MGCDTVEPVDPETRRERFEAVAPGLIEPLRRFLSRRTDPATADDVLADTLLVCWRRFDEQRQALLRAQLERIVATPGLSKDAFEQASKSLG